MTNVTFKTLLATVVASTLTSVSWAKGTQTVRVAKLTATSNQSVPYVARTTVFFVDDESYKNRSDDECEGDRIFAVAPLDFIRDNQEFRSQAELQTEVAAEVKVNGAPRSVRVVIKIPVTLNSRTVTQDFQSQSALIELDSRTIDQKLDIADVEVKLKCTGLAKNSSSSSLRGKTVLGFVDTRTDPQFFEPTGSPQYDGLRRQLSGSLLLSSQSVSADNAVGAFVYNPVYGEFEGVPFNKLAGFVARTVGDSRFGGSSSGGRSSHSGSRSTSLRLLSDLDGYQFEWDNGFFPVRVAATRVGNAAPKARISSVVSKQFLGRDRRKNVTPEQVRSDLFRVLAEEGCSYFKTVSIPGRSNVDVSTFKKFNEFADSGAMHPDQIPRLVLERQCPGQSAQEFFIGRDERTSFISMILYMAMTERDVYGDDSDDELRGKDVDRLRDRTARGSVLDILKRVSEKLSDVDDGKLVNMTTAQRENHFRSMADDVAAASEAFFTVRNGMKRSLHSADSTMYLMGQWIEGIEGYLSDELVKFTGDQSLQSY